MKSLNILELSLVAGGSFELEMGNGATTETYKTIGDCTGPGGVNGCPPSGGTTTSSSSSSSSGSVMIGVRG